MENELNYTLDTSKPSYTKEKCKQLDNRPLVLNLYDNNSPYVLTGATLELHAKKPDGTFVIQNNNITFVNNIVTVNPLNIDITRVSGTIRLELKITKTNLAVSTFTFYLDVEPGVIQDGDPQSTNTLTALEELNTKIVEANGVLGQVDQATDDLNNLIISGGAVKLVDYNADKAIVDTKLNNLTNYTHYIYPTDNPQTIFNAANAGDTFIFVEGDHAHVPTNNNAILYVDKPCNIDIRGNLIIPSNSVSFNSTPEIITNFSPVQITLDDLSVGGNYSLTTGTAYAIQIDSTGSTDTFKWSDNYQGTTVWNATNVAITGDWQNLNNGVQIKFNAITGHALNSLWLSCYGVNPYYGIRVGQGFQTSYIDGVKIYGDGAINGNMANQYSHNEYTKFLPSAILIDGRVSNISISDLSMSNFARPVQVYGESDGIFNYDGTVTGGTSFDVKNVNVTKTKTYDCAGCNIFGFPEHRGKVLNLYFANNYVEGTQGLIECNHMLENYLVENNTYVAYLSKAMLILWRHSKNGNLLNNIMIDPAGGTSIITQSSPGVWQKPENIRTFGNITTYSTTCGINSVVMGASTNTATGQSTAVLGENNNASGNYGFATGYNNTISNTCLNSSILGGAENSISDVGNYSSILGGYHNSVTQAHAVATGTEATTDFKGEIVTGIGKFVNSGDAKITRFGARGLSTTNTYVQILAIGNQITVPNGSYCAYTVTTVGKSSIGTDCGMWKAEGIWYRNTSGTYGLLGNTVTKVYSSAVDWDFTIDTNANNFNLKAKGSASQEVRWVSTVNFTMVRI